MATTESFLISHTDLTPERDFIVAPFTTNGPANPTDSTLDVNAVAAQTSLIFHGKGSPNYGDRIQENILHTMEHFAGTTEPVFPIPGQIWYDRRITPAFNFVGISAAPTLRIFDPLFHEIINVDISNNILSIAGNHTTLAGGAGPTGRFITGMTIRIFDNPTVSLQERLFNVSGVTYNILLDRTEITVSGTIDLTFIGRFLGEWVSIQTANIPLPPGGLDAGGSPIINVPTPINPTDATNKQYVDDENIAQNAQFVDVIGDTMTGFLLLNADPTAALHAATKQYVDNQVAGVGGGLFVNVSGDTMVGSLILAADPTIALEAATKQYVDNLITNHDAEHDDRFLQLTGGTLTGFLTLVGDPTVPFHAATKNYVDTLTFAGLADTSLTAQTLGDIIVFDGVQWIPASNSTEAGVLFLTGGTMTGSLTLNADPVIALQAATKQYVDGEILTAITGGGFADGVVNGGSFNPITQELTLTRTLALPNIVITGIAAATTGGIIDDVNVQHTTATGRTSDSETLINSGFIRDPNFPQLSVRNVLNKLGVQLSSFTSPIPYDQDSGRNPTKLNQQNQIVTVDFNYRVGYNRMMVFVDGIKQTPQKHNFGRIQNLLPAPQGNLYPSTPIQFPAPSTGNTSFTVTVDPFALPAGLPQVISFDRALHFTVQDIVDTLKGIGPGPGPGIVGASVIFANGEIRIYSPRTDIFSRVDIADSEPAPTLWTDLNTKGGATFSGGVVDVDAAAQTIEVDGDFSAIIGTSLTTPAQGDNLIVAGTTFGLDNTYIANTVTLPVFDATTNRTTIRIDSVAGPAVPAVVHPSPGTANGTLSATPFPISIQTLFNNTQKLYKWIGGYVEGNGTNNVGDITNEICFAGDNLPATESVIEFYALDDPTRDD